MKAQSTAKTTAPTTTSSKGPEYMTATTTGYVITKTSQDRRAQPEGGRIAQESKATDLCR